MAQGYAMNRIIIVFTAVFLTFAIHAKAQNHSQDAASRFKDVLQKEYGAKASCPDETQTEIQQAITSTWSKISMAMVAGDLERALTYFSVFSRESNRRQLSSFSAERLKSIFGNYETIAIYTIDEGVAECGVIRKEKTGKYSYPVRFVRDLDCEWRLSGL
jgi:hypothetical protein